MFANHAGALSGCAVAEAGYGKKAAKTAAAISVKIAAFLTKAPPDRRQPFMVIFALK
ncbi:hypothetical protein FACS189445_1870 [Spirochaetia bacterium]|nr:hypothetical protein FACS189445_1870 [Spirochaetia bacterium]